MLSENNQGISLRIVWMLKISTTNTSLEKSVGTI